MSGVKQCILHGGISVLHKSAGAPWGNPRKEGKTMKYFKTAVTCSLACCVVIMLVPWVLGAAELPHPKTYMRTWAELDEQKAFFDDPRPLLKTWGPKQIVPPEVYDQVTFDPEEMKKQWGIQ